MTHATDNELHPRLKIRRFVGLERHYHCDSCAQEHRSWKRMRRCPGCGHTLTTAVIRRAAVA
jgi:hypothetical protein